MNGMTKEQARVGGGPGGFCDQASSRKNGSKIVKKVIKRSDAPSSVYRSFSYSLQLIFYYCMEIERPLKMICDLGSWI